MPTKDPCSELSSVITDLAMMIGEDPRFDTIDKVTEELRNHIPELTREDVVNSIVEATSTHREVLDEARQRLADLKKEARQDAALRKIVAELEAHLDEGTLPESTPRKPPSGSDVVQALRRARDQLRKEIRGSAPAVRKRLADAIDRLSEKLEAVKGVPPVNPKTIPEDAELARLEFEKRRLQRAVRDKINSLRPRTFWSRAGEPFNLTRSIMTSMDFSAVLRQGAFVALGHPGRAAKAVPEMFRSFKSEQVADEAYQSIMDRPNAPLYDRAGLYIAPLDGKLSQQEEAFMSRVAKHIPGVAGSQRAYVTFLNRLRADSFDAMAETLTPDGMPTQEESEAIADYINSATGRAHLGKAEQAGTALATVFFAPRLVVSRFQLLTGRGLRRGPASVRKMVAGEYARFLTGLGVVYTLAMMAGAEIEKDPRSSDFGKLRWGNTRLDPLAGLAQVTTLLSRVVSGKTKNQAGAVTPLRGEDARYGTGVASVVGRFLRTKLSPAAGAALDVADGENVVGEKVTPLSAVGNMMLPLAYRDIYEAMKEHGVAEGTALGTLSLFGMGLSTYGPKTPPEKAKATLARLEVLEATGPLSSEQRRLRAKLRDFESTRRRLESSAKKADERGATEQAERLRGRIESIAERLIDDINQPMR